MEIVIEILKEINIAQLIVIGYMVWFFYNRLDKKIDKLEDKFEGKFDKMENNIDKMGERIDKLSEKVEDIDRRLCRIEGSLATKGHCLMEQSSIQRKAE